MLRALLAVLAGGAVVATAVATEPKAVTVRVPKRHLTVVTSTPVDEKPVAEVEPKTANRRGSWVKDGLTVVATTTVGAAAGAAIGLTAPFHAVGLLGVGVYAGTSMMMAGMWLGGAVGLAVGLGIVIGRRLTNRRE